MLSYRLIAQHPPPMKAFACALIVGLAFSGHAAAEPIPREDKALTYREYDEKSGTELRRFTAMPVVDGGVSASLIEYEARQRFPNGHRMSSGQGPGSSRHITNAAPAIGGWRS